MSSSNDNSPSKTNGQFHSVKGTAVESIGNMTGSESWKSSGKTEHAEGETEQTAAQAKGYVEGMTDRLAGYKDSVVGAVTGDKAQQTSGNVQKEKGTAKQEINKPADS